MSEITNAKRTRCSWSAEERADWVRMFESSGRGLAEFCRENDLPETTLSLWRRQLRGDNRAASEEAPLVEVPVAQLHAATAPSTAPAAHATVRIRVLGGVDMEVAAGTDALWLAGLLRALQPAGD